MSIKHREYSGSIMSQCVQCKNKDVTHKCGGCQDVGYCSTTCQQKHWDEHKVECAALGDHYHGAHEHDFVDRDHHYLTRADVRCIMRTAMRAAFDTSSALRRGPDGESLPTQIHVFVVDRHGQVRGHDGGPDAWEGGIDIARSKAYTAVAFSSNENALSSRSIEYLARNDTGSGAPLFGIGISNLQHGIITFPGGIPLYKHGHLVGAIGVSGDAVHIDELIAAAAASKYAAPPHIIPVGIPYIKQEPLEAKIVAEEK